MPLPPALVAKLLKRGIITNYNLEPAEEVIAEEYDELPAEKRQKTTLQTEQNQLVDKIPACPNLSNSYHSCSDYCLKRYGLKHFKPDPGMLSLRQKMLDKYPLPENCLEVADPDSNRYYYWNTETDEVSWLPPSHPRCHITLSENRLKELNTPLPKSKYDSQGESDTNLDFEDEDDVKELRKPIKKTGRAKKNKDDGEADPMDPSSYSDVPKGDWNTGLDLRGSAKTGVDVTASGPLFQQRPYPSPGAILRMNKGKD